jgi:hypothetical protein
MLLIPVATLETEYCVHPIGSGAFSAEAVDKSYGPFSSPAPPNGRPASRFAISAGTFSAGKTVNLLDPASVPLTNHARSKPPMNTISWKLGRSNTIRSFN